MVSERQGGCLCGKVRYAIATPVETVAICHCTNCRQQSGGAFSINIVVPQEGYSQTGELKMFLDRGDSGNVVERRFCPDCGSPILSALATMPGFVVVKAGTLDDMSGLTPAIEVFTCNSLSWLPQTAAPVRFERGPQ